MLRVVASARAAPARVVFEVRKARAQMQAELSPLMLVVAGTLLWLAGTAASTATIAVATGLLLPVCEHPGETFPVLYETYDHWEQWMNTPVGFTTAVVCMVVSILLAHSFKSRIVCLIAWLSLPLQANFWHGLLLITDGCN